MRESKFVEQNKDKWASFEKDLEIKKKDPQLLRSHLVQITDDLSYSRTFYKNRSVRIYLNGLGQKIYNNIYKNKKNFLKSIKDFYVDDVPKILYFSRKELLVSFLVLLLSVAIGVFSSMKDADFPNSILGDSYVEMTKRNIENGDPLGVYKDSNQLEMFIQIAVNNLSVSLYVFLFGLFASYGALALMIRNGVMLGVFMYFFYSRNLATDFNFTVWMHGTIEILTLVVETVAGMLLGRGLVYPGTLSRVKAFSIWGRRGAMVFLSTVPFILTAAFIESFLTRYTEMPNLLRGTLILFSLAIMVFYFVWYPYNRFKNTKDLDLGIPDLKPETGIDFNMGKIYSNGNIFLKSIQVFSKKFSQIFRLTLFTSIGYLLLILFLNKERGLDDFYILSMDFTDMIRGLFMRIEKFVKLYGNLSLLFNRDETILMYFLSSAWIGTLTYIGLYASISATKHIEFPKLKAFYMSYVFAFVINLAMLINSTWFVFLYMFVSPVILLVVINRVFSVGNKNFIQTFRSYISNGIGRSAGLTLLFTFITFFAMIFIFTPIYYIVLFVLEMNISMSDAQYQFSIKTLMMFSLIFIFSLSVIFLVIQSVFMTYTIKEIADADGLISGIEEIGKAKKAYGIETE